MPVYFFASFPLLELWTFCLQMQFRAVTTCCPTRTLMFVKDSWYYRILTSFLLRESDIFIMESGFPLYFSCITGQGHFLGFAWKGRLDWAVYEQENMSGLEHETHKSIPLLSYIYRDLQLYQILKDWLSLKNILMQKARFTLCTKNRQAAAFSSIISQQVQLTAHHCC